MSSCISAAAAEGSSFGKPFNRLKLPEQPSRKFEPKLGALLIAQGNSRAPLAHLNQPQQNHEEQCLMFPRTEPLLPASQLPGDCGDLALEVVLRLEWLADPFEPGQHGRLVPVGADCLVICASAARAVPRGESSIKPVMSALLGSRSRGG